MRAVQIYRDVAALGVLALGLAVCRSTCASAATIQTVATFNGANGAVPRAGLIADAAGNLYGTTGSGTSFHDGTVFKIAAGTNTISTLVMFNGSNGKSPHAGLIADASGNLYGTTYQGGSTGNFGTGWGTVFKVAAGTNTLTTLVTFDNTNGAFPQGALLADASGNLYGTTSGGGTNGDGTVFKIAAGTNTLTTLATFDGHNINSGTSPVAGLIADASGNLYGTTSGGGSNGDGTVFKVAAGTNTLSTLATFNGTNGATPLGDLIVDAAGNLYGTTSLNGSGSGHLGTVFKVAAGSNTLSTVATFTGSPNGEDPVAGLLADVAGNLYGTTALGGAPDGGGNHWGTVFKVSAGTNTLTTLASFNNTNGATPWSSLIADAAGNLFGTTFGNTGTVFEMTGSGFVTHLPGDANGDGRVDADDYFLIDRGYSERLSGLGNGDFNGDGKVNGDDYFIIDSAFAARASAAQLVSAVPEPASLALLAIVPFFLPRRYR